MFTATAKPRPRSGHSSKDPRHIPAHVKRAVWKRDGGRCTHVDEKGHRCAERKFLEYDHEEPVARGGEATVKGVRLRCHAHNTRSMPSGSHSVPSAQSFARAPASLASSSRRIRSRAM